jgi:hypothetical protein
MTPSTAGTTAAAEKPTTPRMPTKAGNPATTSGTIGMPAAAEMLATSGTHSLAGAQATAMTQATTAMPRAAEMPKTVLTPTTHEFLQNSAKNPSKHKKKVQFCYSNI